MYAIFSPQNGGTQIPVLINWKQLNYWIPSNQFKLEGLLSLKWILLKGKYMGKLHLKVAYVCVPLGKHIRQWFSFLCLSSLYQFICLWFELEPSQKIFTNLLKILTKLLRLHVSIWKDHRENSEELPKWIIDYIIIYIGNFLVLGQIRRNQFLLEVMKYVF